MALKLYFIIIVFTIISACLSHPADGNTVVNETDGKAAQKEKLDVTGSRVFDGSATRKLTATALGLLMAGTSAMAHAARPASGPGAGFGPGPAVQQVEGMWQPPQHAPQPMYPGGPAHTELEWEKRLKQLGITELPHSRAFALQHHRKVQESDKKEKRVNAGKNCVEKSGKRRVLTDLPPMQGDLVAVQDPTLVYAGGSWVLYSSHNGIEERESDDLITWRRPTADSAAFKNTLAEFISPDVSGRYNNLYYMYYAVPPSGTRTSFIGMATSTTGMPGSWQDYGMILINSMETDPFNAMDPNLLMDSGTSRWWLTFGEAQKGIFQVELDPKTGMPLGGSVPTMIAQGPYGESRGSPYLLEKDGWYYLFLSIGSHDNSGPINTIHYGYASSPQGPFLDRDKMPMLEGYGTLLYGGNSVQTRPGGQSVARAGDKYVMAYHYYDASNKNAVTLGLKYLNWTSDGWPFLAEIKW